MGIFDELKGKAELETKEPENGSPGSVPGLVEDRGEDKPPVQGEIASQVVVTENNAITQVVQGEERKVDWKTGAQEQWKIGRPRKYKTPEEFLGRAQEYFESCIDEKGELNQPITITGLCNYLGTYRQQLLDYEHGDLSRLKAGEGDDDGFRDAIKCVKSICEHYAETHGFMARNPAFAIFALKNYGWKDTQTIESTTTEIHEVSPELRAVVGGYLKQLAEVQRRQVIDVTPATLPEPVPAAKEKENVDNPVDK